VLAGAYPRRHMARRAARHVGRHAHRVFVWLGSVAAILILLAAFAIWRLMQGPIELDRLAPYVEAAFDRAHFGLKISLSHVRLGINPETHLLCVWVEGVRLALPNGDPLATFPEMTTSFSFGALFQGRIEPTQFIVERPVVRLVRDESGSFTARIGAPDQTAPDLGPGILQQLAAPPQQDAPLGLLHALRIRGATVIVDDRQSGQRWEAQRVDATVERSSKGARGDLSLAIPIGATMPEVHAAYRYFADRHVLDLDIAIDGVQPSVIPPVVPELAQLRHLEAPISGSFRTRISLDEGKAQGSRLDLSLGKGRLDSEWLPAGSIGIEKGELHAVYAPETAEVRIEKAMLDLGGGTTLALDGSIADVTPELIAAPRDARPAGHVAGKLNATLTHAPVDRFEQLWPRAFSAGGRRWTLANVHDGVLDEATAHLTLDIDPVAHTGNVLSATGKLRYHDLTISYFGSLPPVRKVNGTASFAGNHLEFIPSTGVLSGLKVTGGSLRLTDLGGSAESLTIDLPIAGPLQDVLEVLDNKPLGYMHAMGIDPSQVGGRADTQLHFKFPLLADLKLAQIEYGAKSTISGASINKIALDRGLTDGNFGFELNRDGAHLQGKARFAETPSQIDAEVFFHPKNGPHTRYRVGMTLDDQARKRLEIDITPDRLTGPVGLDLTYSTFDRGRAEATALADLRATSLAIAEAGWKKTPEQPATAKLVFELQDGKFTGTPQVEVKAAGLDGRFGIGLASERKQRERPRRERHPAAGWRLARRHPRHPHRRPASAEGGGRRCQPRIAAAPGDQCPDRPPGLGSPTRAPAGLCRTDARWRRLAIGEDRGPVYERASAVGPAWRGRRPAGGVPIGRSRRRDEAPRHRRQRPRRPHHRDRPIDRCRRKARLARPYRSRELHARPRADHGPPLGPTVTDRNCQHALGLGPAVHVDDRRFRL
jgi:Protein of unknown function